MKLKKGIMFIILLLLSMCCLSVFTQVNAASGTGSLYLNLTMVGRRSGYGYQIASGSKNVWKIYETGKNTDDTIYCLRGGPGFGSADYSAIRAPVETHYTKYFDLKDPDDIPAVYQAPLPDVNGTEYQALLWILDNCYVAPKIDASSTAKAEAKINRDTLLTAATNYAVEQGNPEITEFADMDLLTDDDIDAVQQLAVWYYTNPTGDYHVENVEFYVNIVQGVDANYKALSEDILENGWERALACQALFDYLVKTPQKEGFSYSPSDSSVNTVPVKLSDTSNITVQKVNNRYIVGPYKLEQVRDTQYSLDVFVNDENDNEVTDVIYLDKNKNEIINMTDDKQLVGEEFYISVPSTNNIKSVKFNISGSYTETKLTYWSVIDKGNNNLELEQPVVKVEKITRNFSEEVVTDIPEEPTVEEFDLALRKFIISINGVAPAVDRTPVIDAQELEKLKNGTSTTARKVHPKDALAVKKGDKVVYKIRIYNEGNVNGYASTVIDYLPTGLKLADNSTINTQYGWKTTKDVGTAKTTYLADKMINKFDGTTLDFVDLEIECEVTAVVESKNQNLKNIAEITMHKDEDGNTTVTDRDSQPNNVDKNNYGTTSQEDDDDFEDLIMLGEAMDLALRKFITSINGVAPTVDRTPAIDAQELEKLKNGAITTTNKVHPKDALAVKPGDKVIYKIRVYNEGNIDGYAAVVRDYLPEGLKLADNSAINKQYGWETTKDGKTVKTTYLADKMINKFDGTTLDYKDLEIECEVIATIGTENKTLKNIAEITMHKDKDGNTEAEDRDSKPNNVDKNNYGTTSQEDDDDFEDLVVLGQYFDLSLRKFITEVTTGTKTKNYNRAPQVDVTDLKNETATTATYNHDKTPVSASNGDIVTYTIRIYNEGQLDGYVTEITDHLPEQLEFIVNDELNAKYGWTVSQDGRTVKTDITSLTTTSSANRDNIYAGRTNVDDKVLLKAFDGTTLDYIDVQIRCKVKENIDLYEKITNIAEITEFADQNGDKIIDRDSQKDNVVLPTDDTLPNYKDAEIDRGDTYIPGQQDDDDFEKLVIKRFDLALRKFITGVNDKEITSRAPVFTITENNEYKYVHSKEPVEVANGNTVVYTLRVFNEGNMAGYAEEVKDDLPEGLEYLPTNAINTAFRWKMYKQDGTETTEVKEASYIKTDYLAKINDIDNKNLLKAFDPETMTMPDYRDLKIAFKVTEPNTSDRVIINTAEITEDADEDGKEVEDVDSTPDNNNPDEDDQDIEKIKVKYFDLALKKWVTESIVTYNGKTTITKTGHTGDENPEPPAKVEIRSDRINQTTVKFKFSIKVTNEGEIEGYAKEIIDYIPQGLKFVQEDNPKWRLTDDGKVLTNQLKDVLIKPGESQTVEIILTWINGKNNMGLKTNWAEIYEDDNDYDSPDIDSTPGNDKKGEDDEDDAPVIITTATGSAQTYITLALVSVSIIAGGVILIKKFVIE